MRGSTHIWLHTPVALRLLRLSYRRGPIRGLATCGVMKTDCREVLEEFLHILCFFPYVMLAHLTYFA